MMRKGICGAVLAWVLVAAAGNDRLLAADQPAAGKIKVLIIDGQNNHDWKSTTPLMKKVLEDSGRFSVEVATTPQKPALPPEPKGATDGDLAGYKEALAKYADAYAGYRKLPP